VLTAPWQEANSIDSVLGQAFAAGEKEFASIPRHPWSENLHKASQKVRYWATYITATTTITNHDEVLSTLADDIWPDGPPAAPSNHRVLRKVKRTAERALKRVRRDAATERDGFLQELRRRHATRVAPKGTDEERAVKNLDKQLKDNRRFARITRTLTPAVSFTLTKVELVTSREHIHPATGARHTITKTATIDTHRELEDAIIRWNRRHFAQSEGTPFTRPPLKFINSDNGFNVYRDSNDQNVVLPDDAFIETTTVIEILKERAHNPTTEWSPDVDFDNFISGLLHWRESTSTSPSSRHLGMYKALATAFCNSSDEFSDSSDADNP
jgi:hypothetical protein